MLDDSSAKRSEIPADELVLRAIAKQEAGNPDANAAVADDTRALARRPAEALAAARRLCAGADTVQHIVAASLLSNIADLHRNAVPAVLAELERLLPRA
jgi:hypothetical protein